MTADAETLQRTGGLDPRAHPVEPRADARGARRLGDRRHLQLASPHRRLSRSAAVGPDATPLRGAGGRQRLVGRHARRRSIDVSGRRRDRDGCKPGLRARQQPGHRPRTWPQCARAQPRHRRRPRIAGATRRPARCRRDRRHRRAAAAQRRSLRSGNCPRLSHPRGCLARTPISAHTTLAEQQVVAALPGRPAAVRPRCLPGRLGLGGVPHAAPRPGAPHERLRRVVLHVLGGRRLVPAHQGPRISSRVRAAGEGRARRRRAAPPLPPSSLGIPRERVPLLRQAPPHRARASAAPGRARRPHDPSRSRDHGFTNTRFAPYREARDDRARSAGRARRHHFARRRPRRRCCPPTTKASRAASS